MKTAVVILNWNGKKWLEKFISSVLKSLPNSAELVVADNGSTDGSLEFLSNNYPEVKLIKFDENLGFTGGYNKAISQVDAEYIVLLNSDVEVKKGWIEPLEDFMDKNTDYAACQPKIKWFGHDNMFEYAGASGGFIDKNAYPFCRGRIFNTLEADNGQYDENIDIFWASGASLFIRKSDYENIGGLDDLFFAHMEEIDLCWRLWNSGKKIAVVTESQVWHVGGGSLPRSSARKTYLNFRNNLILIYKNYPISKLKAVLRRRFFLDIIAAFMFGLKGHFGDFSAVFKARRDFSKMKNKFPKSSSKEFPKVIYSGNILTDYYFKRKKFFSDLDFN
ncbi:MAG: glycosyltransferase family 2 protein [Bacteroidales bacterium]|nr:glycosyltransferase family 2 protein [Bacteroidales bacterium]